MAKKHSAKFWIIFWLVSAVFLAGWYLFWQFKNQGMKTADSAIDLLPISQEKKEGYKTLTAIGDFLLQKDDKEKTFMILFQNNMELRPGGGYIGSFGILKIKDGKLVNIQTHDLSNFDGRVPDGIEPPYPMKETLGVSSWKLRDSNWSPDFAVNAQKAEEFYHLGQGQENFDGIIAIDSNVLTSFLKVTGPISIEGYPGTYDSENAILSLEYQVEKGFYKQGISRGERKGVMNALADEILKRASTFSNSQRLKLAEIILDDLKNKDIQLYFKNPELEKQAESAFWTGEVRKDWNGDYLMLVDANMGSLKSDYYVKRSFEYKVDFTGDAPKANLKVTYVHTGKVKDWMTKNYLTYLRIYAPKNSWFTDSKNTGEMKFGEDLGKKYFGTLLEVPLGETKTFEFTYNLPKDITEQNYNLLVEKQSGLGEIPGKVTIAKKDGTEKSFDVKLENYWISQ